MKQRLGWLWLYCMIPNCFCWMNLPMVLDPSGITEIRNIILQLREEGKTILLSSHLLAEVERIASHVGIIKDGTLIFEGTLDALEALKFSQQTVALKINDVANAKKVLSGFSFLPASPGHLHVDVKHKNDIPQIIKTFG